MMFILALCEEGRLLMVLNSDADAAVRECNSCQQSDKSAKCLKKLTQPNKCPMKPWTNIAIDNMGPFANTPPQERNVLIATCIYRQ